MERYERKFKESKGFDLSGILTTRNPGNYTLTITAVLNDSAISVKGLQRYEGALQKDLTEIAIKLRKEKVLYVEEHKADVELGSCSIEESLVTVSSKNLAFTTKLHCGLGVLVDLFKVDEKVSEEIKTKLQKSLSTQMKIVVK